MTDANTTNTNEVDDAKHEYVVAPADELDPGDRLVVSIDGREIGIFNVDGEYYAHLNWCAHQGGPLCTGRVTGRADATYNAETQETELEWSDTPDTLVCPWHDWEFDIESGKCLSNPDAVLPTYPVSIEDGMITLRLK